MFCQATHLYFGIRPANRGITNWINNEWPIKLASNSCIKVHQLPRHTMLRAITPLFTSKLQYALKNFTDPYSAVCRERKKDCLLQSLQVLHNKAMRAALRRSSKDRSTTAELLALTSWRQVSGQ
jgi:hypothetical protein